MRIVLQEYYEAGNKYSLGRRGAAPFAGYTTTTEGSDWIVKCARKISGQPDFWVWYDNIVNNSVSTIPLIQSDRTIKSNDIVEVEMRCIDKNTLRYVTSLQGSQHNATTPANPENKITGGALGYFSAHTTQRKKVKVQ